MPKENIVSLIDLKLYSLGAVYAAAYAFLDKAYIRLEEGPASKVQVILKGKNKLSPEKLVVLRDEFLNELMNCSLREEISKNNKQLREYIIARALASSLMEGGVSSFENSVPWLKESDGCKREQFVKKSVFVKDPLGISVPLKNSIKNKKLKQ